MTESDFPPVPTDSELSRWASDGVRQEITDDDAIAFRSPDGEYTLSIERDERVSGFLVALYVTDPDDRRLARTVVDNREFSLEVAVQMAAAADDLHALPASSDRRTVVSPATSRSKTDTPEEWDDDDDWDDAIEDAYEKAEIPHSKGTLTTKTIDGRDYYYLQWREGEKVKSQYVGPVSPA